MSAFGAAGFGGEFYRDSTEVTSLIVVNYPGNHSSLGPGHLDPATAAQYAMVTGGGPGYDVYKGKSSLQTPSVCPSH